MAVKPSSMKEQVDALWQEVIGLNGGGMRTEIKELGTDVKYIKENMMTKKECATIRAAQQDKLKRYLDIALRVIVIITGIIVALWGSGVLQ